MNGDGQKTTGKLAYSAWESTQGSRHRMAKLNEDDIRAIRAVELPDNQEKKNKVIAKLAKKYAISPEHCRRIIRRVNWRHVV